MRSFKTLRQKKFYYYLTPNNKPTISIDPGETVLVETQDCYRNTIRTDEDRPTSPSNPLSGPLFVKGAKPGDVLGIRIIDIKPLRGYGWTDQEPGFGALGEPMDNFFDQKIPYKLKICPIKNGVVRIPLQGDKLYVPIAPLIGTIGTSPETEISSVFCGRYGGNMDCPDVCIGNTLYLPVFVEGGLLHLGDVHALQGYGELGGSPVEIASETVLTIDVISDKTLRWPRIESSTHLITIGNGRPLTDCVRIANAEMMRWLTGTYGLDANDANILGTNLGDVRINQFVNQSQSVEFTFPKKYLLKS